MVTAIKPAFWWHKRRLAMFMMVGTKLEKLGSSLRPLIIPNLWQQKAGGCDNYVAKPEANELMLA